MLRYSVINSREFDPQQPASTIEKIIKFIHFPVSDSFDQKLPVSTFSRQLRSFINLILDSVEIPELRDPMLLFESRFRYCCQLPPWVSSTYYYLNLNLDSNFNIYFEKLYDKSNQFALLVAHNCSQSCCQLNSFQRAHLDVCLKSLT